MRSALAAISCALISNATWAQDACVPNAAPLDRSASRSLIHLANLRADASACPLTAGERATYDLFKPSKDGPDQVDDGIDALRFERPRFKGLAADDDCGQRHAVLTCAERYGDAMKGLENAVAYAAIRDPAVLGMSRRLAKRLAMILRARATREVLGDTRRRPNPAERERIERTVDAKLNQAYGTCTADQAGCLSAACEAKGGTCAADQARRLRAALGEGNLRETMFFLYMSNGVLTENASRPARKGDDAAAVTAQNVGNVDFINSYLKSKNETWTLTNLPVTYETPFILARTGFGADNNGMRDWRSLADGKTGCVNELRTIADAPVPSLEMIALSPRETEVLSKRLGVDPRRLGEQPLPYHSGESCFALKHDITDARYVKYNPLLKNTRDARIPMLTGISGTTDSLMTLGRTLGLHSREDFELLRAAALGWLVSSRDHSVHEVMTAASSFKELAPYRFRPDAYKSMLPQHPGFARDVEAYQRAHGLPLPADLLKTCLTTREASR